jgi:lactoylglutathione lyase
MTSETTPVAIARIDRFALWTGRLERLRDFYARQLGAQASPIHVDPGSGLRAVLLDFRGVGLELIEPPTVAEHPRRAARVGLLLHRSFARLRRRRRPAHRTPGRGRPPGRRAAAAVLGGAYRSVVLDPDGNRVELTV